MRAQIIILTLVIGLLALVAPALAMNGNDVYYQLQSTRLDLTNSTHTDISGVNGYFSYTVPNGWAYYGFTFWLPAGGNVNFTLTLADDTQVTGQANSTQEWLNVLSGIWPGSYNVKFMISPSVPDYPNGLLGIPTNWGYSYISTYGPLTRGGTAPMMLTYGVISGSTSGHILMWENDDAWANLYNLSFGSQTVVVSSTKIDLNTQYIKTISGTVNAPMDITLYSDTIANFTTQVEAVHQYQQDQGMGIIMDFANSVTRVTTFFQGLVGIVLFIMYFLLFFFADPLNFALLALCLEFGFIFIATSGKGDIYNMAARFVNYNMLAASTGIVLVQGIMTIVGIVAQVLIQAATAVATALHII